MTANNEIRAFTRLFLSSIVNSPAGVTKVYESIRTDMPNVC
jgi:hypothetical protein